MVSRAYEGKLNILLALMLSEELGPRAICECVRSPKRPDVLVLVNGVKVVLEGSYSKADAERDFRRRLGEGLGDFGVALHYLRDYPNASDAELLNLLRGSTFDVKLMIPEDISGTLKSWLEERQIEARPITEWATVGLPELVSMVYDVSQFVIAERDVEEAIDEIERLIDDFANRLVSLDREATVARRLYDVFYKLYGLSVGDYRVIRELIYAKAALTLLLSASFYQSVHSIHGLPDIASLVGRHGAKLGMREAFETIYRVSHRPVYDLAIRVVDTLPDALEPMLERLAECAAEISSKRTLLRRDFSGKVYHRVVGDWAVRKNFATYFTTTPAAYLLAYLAVFTNGWSAPSELNGLRVCDFACGSGTLLIAIYSALKDLYIRKRLGQGEEVDLGDFHRKVLEDVIWGFDTLRYASQVTAAHLALQNPETRVSRINTFAVPLGRRGGRVILGSLVFLSRRTLPNLLPYCEGHPAERASIVDEGGTPPKIPDRFSLVIMNPPFTRATGRGGRSGGGLFGFIPDEEVRSAVVREYRRVRDLVRRDLQATSRDVYQELGADLRELLSIGQAGEGLLFLYLASRYVKEGGRIAFVLPKSLLTGVSWFLARALLLEEFNVDHIVVSYDRARGYNFSESTSLSEVLIVATKRRSAEGRTKVTVLLRKPETSLEAKALALKILGEEGCVSLNRSEAYVRVVDKRKLRQRIANWGALAAFPDPELVEVADDILSGKIFGREIPMRRLGEIASIGIDRRQFHDNFTRARLGAPDAFPAVYGGAEAVRTRMAVRPNAGIVPRNRGGELFASFSSRLLVPDRIRVNTAHVISTYSREPVLSNIFYAVRLREGDETATKALCLWLNTTFGILSVLANRSETEGMFVGLKMTHWRLQPVLDVVELEPEVLRRLAEIFDRYSEREPRRLPEQYDPSEIDPVRLSIDSEFLEAVGVSCREEALRELYARVHQSLQLWRGS
ncbi:MAG TPA: hypothetical protein ENG69_03170 [Candidatus Korarchaeota archaeon]|nr:hypothetical protein [Candidatus Korarchaeota archaeon]